MSATFDPRQYLAEFLFEAGELLASLDDLLLQAERQGPRTDDALLKALFRNVHTLKGMAGMLGFSAMVTLAHETESLFDAVRAGKRRLGPGELAVLFDVADALERLVARVAASGDEGGEDVLPVQAALFALERAAREAATPLDLLDRLDPHDQMAVLVDVAKGQQLFNLRAETGLKDNIAALGNLLGSWEPAEPGTGQQDFLLLTELPQETLCERLALPAHAATPAPLPWDPHADTPAPPETKVPQTANPPLSALRRIAPKGPASVPAPLSARVEAGQLERIAALAEELERRHAELGEAIARLAKLKGTSVIAKALTRTLEAAEATRGELTTQLARARLVPAGALFNRYGRLVRDLARECGKPARLSITGADTLAERATLDALAEPLVHLLRNALDHGLELPAARQAAGKPAEGLIALEARREGDELVVGVSDDGRGIDRAGVLARARAHGLLGPDEEPDDTAVWALICHPGLSTAAEVSRLSGRGVGMDAVQAGLERLGGRLTIATQPGRGSTFELRVPTRAPA